MTDPDDGAAPGDAVPFDVRHQSKNHGDDPDPKWHNQEVRPGMDARRNPNHLGHDKNDRDE
jgi:hypothetical protein